MTDVSSIFENNGIGIYSYDELPYVCIREMKNLIIQSDTTESPHSEKAIKTLEELEFAFNEIPISDMYPLEVLAKILSINIYTPHNNLTYFKYWHQLYSHYQEDLYYNGNGEIQSAKQNLFYELSRFTSGEEFENWIEPYDLKFFYNILNFTDKGGKKIITEIGNSDKTGMQFLVRSNLLLQSGIEFKKNLEFFIFNPHILSEEDLGHDTINYEGIILNIGNHYSFDEYLKSIWEDMQESGKTKPMLTKMYLLVEKPGREGKPPELESLISLAA